MNNMLFVVVTTSLFLLNPFFTSILLLVMMYNRPLNNLQVKWNMVLIASFWGLLSYTQKSLADVGTDIERYYYSMQLFEDIKISDVFYSLNWLELINFVFYPISAYVISLTGNVQSMAFLWVFICYFISYYTIFRLLKYHKCYTNKFFFQLILISTFCFMVFVQISELLKNASAITFFFLAITLYMEKGWNKWVVFWLFISIGLHPSVFMLFPLFLYKHIKTRTLFIVSACIFPIVISVNIFDYLWSVIPSGDYFAMLEDRFSVDFESTGSIHYLLKQLLMVSLAYWVWLKTGKSNNYICNLVVIYFIISSFNFVNLTAYLRFSLFSHFLFTILLVEYLKNVNSYKLDRFMTSIIILMFLLTLRYSIGRTSSGGYASSYMDNSFTKIVFSTSFDYLSVEYDK